MSGWLYNGSSEQGRPGDPGYWMGYRIVAAYYARAGDKVRAIRDILTIADFEAFLDQSGLAGELEAAPAGRDRPD